MCPTQKRVKRLERGILALAGVVLVEAVAWTVGSIQGTTSDDFVLSVDGGRMGSLGAVSEGSMLLLKADSEDPAANTAALRVNTYADETILTFDSDNAGSAWVGVSATGPELVMTDETGVPRIRLLVTEAGPIIELLDADGAVVWSAR